MPKAPVIVLTPKAGKISYREAAFGITQTSPGKVTAIRQAQDPAIEENRLIESYMYIARDAVRNYTDGSRARVAEPYHHELHTIARLGLALALIEYNIYRHGSFESFAPSVIEKALEGAIKEQPFPHARLRRPSETGRLAPVIVFGQT